MSRQPLPSGYGTPPPVVPPNPGRATLRRSPGGVRLPWLVSLLVLLALAAGFALLLNRGPSEEVPQAVLETRAGVAHATAQGMRKGLDEASDDLAVLATVLAERSIGEWDDQMARFIEVHRRYQVVYLVDQQREVVLSVGDARPRAELLPDPLPTVPGLTRPQPAGNLPALLAYTPLGREGQPPLVLVGRYDVSFFVPALRQTAPGTGYVVDVGQKVVGSTAGFLSFQDLPDPGLQAAAQRAAAGSEISGAFATDEQVVAFAPIRGDSPAGRLGMAVVSSVDRRDLALPRNDARRLALLLGVLTGLVGLLVMFWMYLFVIGPVRGVARDAERIAFGDRSEPLHVVRYDEVGLITRALERCRTLLRTSTKGR